MVFINDMNSYKSNLPHVIGDFHRKFPDFAGTGKPLASLRLRNFHKELENVEFFNILL